MNLFIYLFFTLINVLSYLITYKDIKIYIKESTIT